MKRFYSKIILMFTLTALTASAASAQKVRSLPFAAGETLSYEAKVSKIISSMAVADVTFTVGDTQTPGMLEISADAKSKGTLLKLARYSFLYQFTSHIDTAVWRVEHTERITSEKERQRTGKADFDYGEKRVTYIETDPTNPMRPPRKIASGIQDDTQDVVSGIYSLRLLPLGVGKRFNVTLSDTGLVYDVPVRVTARELQKTMLGKVWCYRVEPDVFGPGHMIEDEGKMAIWITDDPRRIPVRSRIDSSFGRIEIRLKSITNTKQTVANK